MRKRIMHYIYIRYDITIIIREIVWRFVWKLQFTNSSFVDDNYLSRTKLISYTIDYCIINDTILIAEIYLRFFLNYL